MSSDDDEKHKRKKKKDTDYRLDKSDYHSDDHDYTSDGSNAAEKKFRSRKSNYFYLLPSPSRTSGQVY